MFTWLWFVMDTGRQASESIRNIQCLAKFVALLFLEFLAPPGVVRASHHDVLLNGHHTEAHCIREKSSRNYEIKWETVNHE